MTRETKRPKQPRKAQAGVKAGAAAAPAKVRLVIPGAAEGYGEARGAIVIKRTVKPTDLLTDDHLGPSIFEEASTFKEDAETTVAIFEDDKRTILEKLYLAINWVQGGRKLPTKLLEELVAFEKLLEATRKENLLLTKINAAHAAGFPLRAKRAPDALTMLAGSAKLSAFEVVAKELGVPPATVQDEFYRIRKESRSGALPLLARTPKPKRKR